MQISMAAIKQTKFKQRFVLSSNNKYFVLNIFEHPWPSYKREILFTSSN